MLSAESASGQYPVEAVTMMDRIARHTQGDPDLSQRSYRAASPICSTPPPMPSPRRQNRSRKQSSAVAIVTYTTSGSTTLRAARERPEVPILCLTSKLETARRLTLSFGVHAVHTADVKSFSEMVQKALQIALARRHRRCRPTRSLSRRACHSARRAAPMCCASPRLKNDDKSCIR